ncbi:glyoxylate reductase [Neorhodopirellula lusitana]|uniref:Glyoxylate reductase n=1 Tax=Neorhodopirellula lusitana TaxID=445327 RepID=A0ABY1QHA9_9BACT|nr:D-glycerate dehydrogenase [Neorhodopirellula lusitana]SMP68614.1 glyoxylate reductase [Neorhodopirellula lusitana]
MNDSNLPKIFVTRQMAEKELDRLRSVAQVEVWPDSLPPSREILLQKVAGCDAMLTLLSDRIDEQVLDAAGVSLKVVSNYAVGYNNIDVEAAKQRGIRVGNTPDVLTDATADLAVTLMFAATRRVNEAADQVKNGQWTTWEPNGLLGKELAGRTLGVIGMGRIGKAFAQRMVGGWNMRLVYTSRTEQADVNGSLGGQRVELDELLAQSDFISVHVALCDATREMLNKETFAKMKDGVVLVNTARGETIDQDALVDALDSEKVFAAGLDVTTPEPLDHNHPLVQHPRTIILPHIGSATDCSRLAMAEIAVDNILAGLEGKPLRCEVNA